MDGPSTFAYTWLWCLINGIYKSGCFVEIMEWGFLFLVVFRKELDTSVTREYGMI